MRSSILASSLALSAALSVNALHNDYLNYTVVPGLFLQDDPATNASTFNFTASNFGLINRSYPSDNTCKTSRKTQWERFAHYVSTLNAQAPSNVEYKLLYMGRHGEGYHNAAETYYGTPAWNCYWGEKDGNGTVVWADAKVTPLGAQQALAVNALWARLIPEGIPTPESYYTSPLMRCLETALLTFNGLDLPKRHPFVPTVKEYFREGISAHTCDRRSSKSEIHASYPTYKIERGFTENDELWEALHAEPSSDQDLRSKAVLDDVFRGDVHTYLSITSHSGEIASLLRVLGHRVFSLSTGAAIPVLVKVTKLSVAPPTTTHVAFTSVSTCATAPTVTASTCDDCSCCK